MQRVSTQTYKQALIFALYVQHNASEAIKEAHSSKAVALYKYPKPVKPLPTELQAIVKQYSKELTRAAAYFNETGRVDVQRVCSLFNCTDTELCNAVNVLRVNAVHELPRYARDIKGVKYLRQAHLFSVRSKAEARELKYKLNKLIEKKLVVKDKDHASYKDAEVKVMQHYCELWVYCTKEGRAEIKQHLKRLKRVCKNYFNKK
jgi:hypothetical protein